MVKKVLKADNPEDMKIIAQDFADENEELFKLVGERVNSYAQNKNALFLNWISQALINLLKDANNTCRFKLLGIDESTKVQ
ncbi:MAG: hypothetical protein ACKVE4_10500 [Dissulfuribacterales bacterium]